jgi:hypothetical protein
MYKNYFLPMSFSTDIANNLIEKHETSEATTNIRAVKAAQMGNINHNHPTISCGGSSTR